MPDQQGLSRRDRRHLDTREEILVAARELLLEVGLEALSLRQVARRTDFSPAALYTYFTSRDELVAALFANPSGVLTRISAASLRLSPDKRVVELGMAYLDFARENPVDLRCILASTSQEGLPTSSGVGSVSRRQSCWPDLPRGHRERGLRHGPAALRRRDGVCHLGAGAWHGSDQRDRSERGAGDRVACSPPRSRAFADLLMSSGRRCDDV